MLMNDHILTDLFLFYCVYACIAAYVTLEEAKELILQMIQKMKRKCKKYPEVSLRSIKTALTVCAMNIGYLQLRRANFVEAVNVCKFSIVFFVTFYVARHSD